MSGLEITGIIVGGLASGEAARRTLWKWGRSLFRGAHAVAKFGEALPKLTTLPERMDRLETKIQLAREEVENAAQELRDHMAVEDTVELHREKAWVQLIATQHQLTRGQADVHHEVENLQQIVMNQQDPGSGDRWRLTHHEQLVEAPESAV